MMNTTNFCKSLLLTAVCGSATSLSQGAMSFENQDFEGYTNPTIFETNTPFNLSGETAFVSNLGGSNALRMTPRGEEALPLFDGGAINADIQDIWDEALSGLGLNPALFGLDAGVINERFPDVQSISLLHSEVFEVDFSSLLAFDYEVNAPLFQGDEFGSPFAFSFYFLMNDSGEFNFDTFGHSSNPFDRSGTQVFGVPGDTMLDTEAKYFLAIGSMHGERVFDEIPDFELLGAPQSFQFLDLQGGGQMHDEYSVDIDNLRQLTAVPEPSTYGLIGGIFLAGLIGHRRLRAKRARASTQHI